METGQIHTYNNNNIIDENKNQFKFNLVFNLHSYRSSSLYIHVMNECVVQQFKSINRLRFASHYFRGRLLFQLQYQVRRQGNVNACIMQNSIKVKSFFSIYCEHNIVVVLITIITFLLGCEIVVRQKSGVVEIRWSRVPIDSIFIQSVFINQINSFHCSSQLH